MLAQPGLIKWYLILMCNDLVASGLQYKKKTKNNNIKGPENLVHTSCETY